MKFKEYQEKLGQIRKLASNRNTGTPKELARSIYVSERTLYRLINDIQDSKAEITYCRKSKSYVLIN